MNVMLHSLHCVKYLFIHTTFLELPLIPSSDSTNTTKPVMVDPMNRAISKFVYSKYASDNGKCQTRYSHNYWNINNRAIFVCAEKSLSTTKINSKIITAMSAHSLSMILLCTNGTELTHHRYIQTHIITYVKAVNHSSPRIKKNIM